MRDAVFRLAFALAFAVLAIALRMRRHVPLELDPLLGSPESRSIDNYLDLDNYLDQ